MKTSQLSGSLVSKLKLIFIGLFLVMVVGVGFWIGADNTERISPTLLGYDMPEWTLGVWLTLMLLAGGFIGFIVSWFGSLKIKARNRNLQRKLQKWEQGTTRSG